MLVARHLFIPLATSRSKEGGKLKQRICSLERREGEGGQEEIRDVGRYLKGEEARDSESS